MNAPRHPSARTTPVLRKILRASEKSDRALAAEFKINRKTVAKWRGRKTTRDAPLGPRSARLLRLDEAEEALIVDCRLITRLTLDGCFTRLREVLPTLSRSALHRCLKRHGFGRLRRGLSTTLEKGARSFIPGHVWITVHGQGGDDSTTPALFAAIERNSGRLFCRRLPPTRLDAAGFLNQLIAHSPAPITVAVTANDPLFVPSRREHRPDRHPFARACYENNITHWPELPAAKSLAAGLRAKPRQRRRRPKL